MSISCQCKEAVSYFTHVPQRPVETKSRAVHISSHVCVLNATLVGEHLWNLQVEKGEKQVSGNLALLGNGALLCKNRLYLNFMKGRIWQVNLSSLLPKSFGWCNPPVFQGGISSLQLPAQLLTCVAFGCGCRLHWGSRTRKLNVGSPGSSGGPVFGITDARAEPWV